MSGDNALQDVGAWMAAHADKVIETSCARIYLAGQLAWKVKRPVELGFLDFSTLERRGWALGRELEFNTPDIYKAVRRITREPDGLAFDGPGETVEYALEMRRFDESAVLDARPELVNGDLAEALGRAIARYHQGAPVTPEGGGVGALGYTITSNADHLRKLAGRLGDVEPVIEATRLAFEAAAPLLEARRVEGFARRCHGDLHLGNILLEDGAPVLFDCIEFNDQLSNIDVQYDVAFLLMDLAFRGRPEASRVLSAWLDEAARSFPESLWSGLAVLPLMLSVRAVVRCHVRAHAADDEGARAYLAAALEHLRPVPPVLVAVGGLSGSGKSTLARLTAPTLGAVVLRTDEIRKRLWGVAPLERLPQEAYSREAGESVYARMFHEARLLLEAGRAVVLDAAFLRPAEREAADTLAARVGVPFQGVWLEGAPQVLRGRLAARTGDASDANAAVLEAQLGYDLGQIAWPRLSVEADFGAEAARLVKLLVD